MRYQVYVTIGTFSDELEAALRYDEQAARLGKPVNFPEDGTNQKKASKWGSASAAALASPRSSFLQHDESQKESADEARRGEQRLHRKVKTLPIRRHHSRLILLLWPIFFQRMK